MIYTYYCDNCTLRLERICSLAMYEASPNMACTKCGKKARRTYTVPRIFARAKFEPFKSPVDGTIISSHAELAEHNKRNGVVNLHDGYDEKAIKAFDGRNLTEPTEVERKQDLGTDMKEAIQKLEDGYKPTPAEYTEEIPNA